MNAAMIYCSLASLPQPAATLAALSFDAVIGDPPGFYRRWPHPVQWIGAVIAWADRRFNRENDTPSRLRRAGMALAAGLAVGGFGLGCLLQSLLLALPWGPLWLGLLMSVLIAQRSLYTHVAAVAEALSESLSAGREKVAQIVGRDPEALDEAGVSRAAIESLAENFSDGVVAPAFWALVLGLPGLIAYKAINTADSMVGHKTDRHLHFGWASARLDDLLNLIPSRLSGLWIVLASMLMTGANSAKAWTAMMRDARHHKSPSAGWPEAAMAGALGLALAGPRAYHGQMIEDHWMGSGGNPHAAAPDIRRALRLFVGACLVQALTVAAIAWFSH